MEISQNVSARVSRLPKRAGTWSLIPCHIATALAALMMVSGTAMSQETLRRWLPSLDEGYRDAISRKRPILVRFGSESCPWCRKLDVEIAKPPVQAELSNWTLVELDIEKTPADAVHLAVGPIPALRVLSPRKRLLASRDGFLEAEKLIEWLVEQRESAAPTPDDVLFGDGEPSLLDVVRVIRQFGERDATLREAAIRRLSPFPKAAAAAVMNSLREGNLSTRLTAMELLSHWQAPVSELDPWRPETITDQRLGALDEWLKSIDATPISTAPEKLSEEQLQNARLQLEYLLKADPSEAAAIRERLAPLGQALLPEVLARLRDVATDEHRERLLALRYRLVCDNALVLSWPGGLERLASTDIATRHAAAEELAASATSAQQPLLLALFSDPDPLVREISLRGLRQAGDKQTSAALVDLLNDPEPNVRAAVLKQLAEDEAADLIDKVAAYVAKEKDADLLVHAARYFRATKRPTVVVHLLPLLEHESWQVRAEATETVAATMGNAKYGDVPENADEIYDALLKRLADPDPFVVNRALSGLGNIKVKRAVEPLVNAAAAHPELASTIVGIIAKSSVMREAAVPRLKEFSQSENPEVRAAAVSGLAKSDPENARTSITAALRDQDFRVRIAAADTLLELLNAGRPTNGMPGSGGLFGAHFGSIISYQVEPGEVITSDSEIVESTVPANIDEPAKTEPMPDSQPDAQPAAKDTEVDEAADKPAEAAKAVEPALDKWLSEVYAGKRRDEWMNEVIAPLEEMLVAKQPEERIAAALVLIPLNRIDSGLPVIVKTAEEQPALMKQAASVLTWLQWELRVEVFWKLFDAAKVDSDREILIHTMASLKDDRAADTYFRALEHLGTNDSSVAVLQDGLRDILFPRGYYDASAMNASVVKRVKAATAPYLDSKSSRQRVASLDLLLLAAPDDALAAANRILEDAAAEEALRQDAFVVTLLAEAPLERVKKSIGALAGSDKFQRTMAIKYLALGSTALMAESRLGFTFYSTGDDFGQSSSSGQPIVPKAPLRLTVDHVRPLLTDPDKEIAAYAGYLLTLLGEEDGIGPLLSYWQAQAFSEELDQLVYRAIAVLDDPQHIPILKRIYGRLSPYARGEFYWTIRIMTGPEILAFRQQIRNQVGLENLR